MLSKRRLPAAARDESGITLIETLVATATGIVVILALFAILEVSVKQTARLSDVAQATQLGRTAMTHVVDELHSVCLSEGFAPVQAGSNGNELIVVDGYGEAPEVPSVGTASTGVREDKIVWSPTGAKAGTLIDYTYYATGTNSEGEYTFSSTASPTSGVLLGQHITKMKEKDGVSEQEQPIFKYYAYATTASTSTTAISSALNEKTLVAEGKSLEKEAASTVASVVVSFNTAPVDNEGSHGREAPLTTQVTFAFSTPNAEATIKASPCE
jgi:Tfp pilus assembly protein PilW